MSRTTVSRLAQRASRNSSQRLSTRNAFIVHRATSPALGVSKYIAAQSLRSLSSTQYVRIGLQPDTSNPKPKERESTDTASSSSKVEVSDERYHQLSESYLNSLVEKLEALQEEREDVDVEYSVSTLGFWLRIRELTME